MNNFKITGSILHISEVSRKSTPFVYGIINSKTEKNGKITSSLNMPFIAFENIAEDLETIAKGDVISAEGYLKERTYKEQRQIQFAIQKFLLYGGKKETENDFEVDYSQFESETKKDEPSDKNPFASSYNPFDE